MTQGTEIQRRQLQPILEGVNGAVVGLLKAKNGTLTPVLKTVGGALKPLLGNVGEILKGLGGTVTQLYQGPNGNREENANKEVKDILRKLGRVKEPKKKQIYYVPSSTLRPRYYLLKIVAFCSFILVSASPALPLRLAQRHRPDSEAVEASDFLTGAFNVCSIVTFSDGVRVVVRFPILSRSRFRIEKTNDELLIIGFLSARICVPIPRILSTSMWDCGPYTVTAFAPGPLLSKCLSSPSLPGGGPDVCVGRLRRAYRAMADIMLELNAFSFPRIGSVGYDAGQ
ncbi:hypothetical protein HIM_03634 [Hirsutella minnesotensis 3608]|uniref:Aminoglycoside phosphotransferase domain-containing protein n=1 Tax=Hirsutella minnesotensis 3608 TaxID=1043627 RepID=A0A0F8A261_9HYPO|nr:hypothetical protein HIM_03634 [Hirsutella minnesotensis 3608]